MLEVARMLLLHRFEMRGQVCLHHAREHRHPVLVALASPHDDLVPGKVDVLHPEVGALEQPEAGAVEQQGHQASGASETADDGSDLTAGENDGKPLGALGPDDVVEPRHVLLEHVAVQEEHGAQRLVLGGRGHIPLDGERAEKRRDLDRAHLRRCRLP
jgi:hypothetical protein